MKVLVTGASGFIGSALTAALAQDPRFTVRAAVRTRSDDLPETAEQVVAGDLALHADPAAFVGIDVVVHLAGRAHIMKESAPDPLRAFRNANVEGTTNVAHLAVEAGVRRFIFMSTLKVHGESGGFTEADAPAPADPYALSKLEAEAALVATAAASGLEVVIIRPPLVYGPGVRANFLSLIRAVRRGMPLPVGAVRNRRSLVGTRNLVDFITTCLVHPGAAGETFLVSDGEDVSTKELVQRIARALNVSPRMLHVPPTLLRGAANVLGARSAADRLLGSLWADISKARTVLRWDPPVRLDDGIADAVRYDRPVRT